MLPSSSPPLAHPHNSDGNHLSLVELGYFTTMAMAPMPKIICIPPSTPEKSTWGYSFIRRRGDAGMSPGSWAPSVRSHVHAYLIYLLPTRLYATKYIYAYGTFAEPPSH